MKARIATQVHYDAEQITYSYKFPVAICAADRLKAYVAGHIANYFAVEVMQPVYWKVEQQILADAKIRHRTL